MSIFRPRFNGPDLAKARGAAASIIRKYGIQNSQELDLEAIAWGEFRTLVSIKPLTGCDARAIHTDSGGIIALREGSDDNRQRFSLAHELGHLALHGSINQLAFSKAQNLLDYRLIRPEEREADAFAVELLMPERWISPQCQAEPSFKLLQELSAVFRTSLTAAAIRYIEYSPYCCAVLLCENGQVKTFLSSRTFRWEVRSRLDKDTHAYDFFFGDRTPTEAMKQNLRGRWLENYSGDAEAFLREQTRSLGKFGALTLLWIESEEDDEEDSWY